MGANRDRLEELPPAPVEGPHLPAVALAACRDFDRGRLVENLAQLGEDASAPGASRQVLRRGGARIRLVVAERVRDQVRFFEMRHGSTRIAGRSARRTFATARNTLCRAAVGVCPSNISAKGPGDCGSPGKGYSRLTRTDASGKLTITLKVPKGNLGATLRPTEKCGNKKKDACSVHASTIGGNVVTAKSKVLKYK